MAIVQTALLLAVTLTGAITDLTRGKVYNWLTYPAAAVGLALSFTSGPPTPLSSIAGLGLALLLFGTLRKVGKMGAGDVKLMAVVGSIKGPVFLVYASFYVVVAAGLAALIVLALRRRLIPTLRWAASLVVSSVVPGFEPRALGGQQNDMPFAPAIFVGVAYLVYLEAVVGPLTF
jgi:prepilin peptidase CpaA